VGRADRAVAEADRSVDIDRAGGYDASGFGRRWRGWPRGPLLEVRGGDERVLERCERLGYLLVDGEPAAGSSTFSIGKPGRGLASLF